jgi:hypothetical protein
MTPTKLVEQFVANGIGLVVLVLLTHIAGRVLGGQGELTPTFRALAFANATRVFQLLGLIPVLGSLFRAAGTLITFLATWLALQESMHLRGWRAALFPLLIIVIVVLTAAVSGLIFSGVQFTLEAVLLRLGFAPGR